MSSAPFTLKCRLKYVGRFIDKLALLLVLNIGLAHGQASLTKEIIYLDGKAIVVENISSSDTTAPTVAITSPTSNPYNTTSSSIDVSGTASDAQTGVTQVSWANNRGGSGSCSGTTSWTCSVTGLQSGDNVLAITAQDGAGNSGYSNPPLTVNYTPPDTAPPTVAIASPTSNPYNTSSSSVQVSGTAWDAQSGVAQVSWTNNRGGSGLCSGTTSWTCSVTGLQSGDNVLTITAQDGIGNSGYSNPPLTVNYNLPDTTPPTVAITSPTSNPYNTSSSSVQVSGTAWDAQSGVAQVSWTNNRGGSGLCSGTTSWTCSVTGLQSGDNVLTITAQDGIGNSGYSNPPLTVNYNLPDTTPPTVAITSPTSNPYNTSSSSVQVSGTAWDAQSGVAQVSWANNRGGSGSCSGTTSWTCSVTGLQSGDNVLTITAQDGIGNSGYSNPPLTVNYTPPDTMPPTVMITSPTSDPTYYASMTPTTLGGTASDAESGVAQVNWTIPGVSSGSCSGTTSWTCSNIPIQIGSNSIIVTGYDGAGNPGTDSITMILCTYDTNPTQVSVPASGAVDSLTFSITPSFSSCHWWEEPYNTPWLTTSPRTGTGNITISYSAEPNTTGAQRTGYVWSQGAWVTFTQPACMYSISPTGVSMGAGGGEGSVSVEASAGCSWTATGNDWVHITSGSSGAGNGTVTYSVDPNYSSSGRGVSINIAGNGFYVDQAGSSQCDEACLYYCLFYTGGNEPYCISVCCQ